MRIQALAAVVLPLLVLSAGPEATSDPSTSELVKAAARYLAQYQQQLTAIIADEIYTQEIRRQIPLDPQMPRTRSMKSEVFFMFAPDDRHWMTIRDVMEVDARPLDARPNLREALQTLPASEVARSFKASNSKWNIGRIARNFNEPTLSLLVLDGEHRARFKFDRKAIERGKDVVLVTLAYTEKERPTLIADPSGRHAFAKGELLIEAGTGRVRRATLGVELRGVRVELVTEYEPNEKLGLWVPAVFRERYERRRDEYEHIVCEARYRNYRRFDVLTRIK